MRKFILNSYEWYDNLPEPKRTIFFFIVIGGSLVVAQWLMVSKIFIWAFPIWATTIFLWRGGYGIQRS